MKKPALTLLALVVLLLAGLAFWLSLDGSGRGAESAPKAAPAVAAAEPTPPPVEQAKPSELQPAAAVPAPAESAAPAVADEVHREAVQDGSGRRIAGHVKFPSAAPADETLRVLALDKALGPRETYGKSGVLEDLAAGKKAHVLGTAPVGADGGFELALGSEDEVWLVLDGRFLSSRAAERAPAGTSEIELAAELGGCLAGRVKLPAGTDAAALADVKVELGADSQNFSLSTMTQGQLFERRAQPDAEGRFELRALPAGVVHALKVEADAFADASVPDMQFEPGRVREVEVALVLGATLSGVVHDESGAPVVEAEVRAAGSGIWGFPGEERAKGKTDASGAFQLAHVAPGKALLLAKKEGFLESEAMKLDLRDAESRGGIELVVATGAAISGRVTLPGGTPAADAELAVSFDPEAMAGLGALNAARGASGKSKADAEGRFEVRGLGKGPFVVMASLERKAADDKKETWRAKQSAVKPDTHDVALELSAPFTVSGRVHDLAGAPVTKFTVRATRDSAAFFLPGETRPDTCDDPEGDFVLRGLEAGKWKLSASADGFGPMTPLELTFPRSADDPVELVLAPAATIAGTVVDAAGVPVSGARVELHADLAQRIQRLSDEEKGPEATSDEHGAFLLTGLAPGTSSIVAQHDGFAASEPQAVESSAEAPAKGVVLKLRNGALLTGEVYAKDGKRAPGLQIIAQATGGLDVNRKNADGRGEFRFEHLAPGSWTITALLEGGEVETEGSAAEVSASFMENMRFTMVTLEDGKEEHVVLGAPPKDPVLVRGTVRHGDRPVGGGIVSFVAEGSKGFEAFKMASLDPDGRYQAELGAPGRYLVTVQVTAAGGTFQQNSVEFSETIPEEKETVLDLSLPLGALRGSVRVSGKPQAGTRVTLAADGGVESGTLLGGQYAEATTDEGGNYVFDYLRPGNYSVAAGGALFGGAFGNQSQAGRLVRSGLRVDEGKALENVDFNLEEPGDIHGRVVDANGAAIKDAALFVRDGNGRLLDRFSMITSSADGSFTYKGVAAGEYMVSARGKGMASAESAAVRVEKGGTASVELVLYPGTKLVVEVVNDEGALVKSRVSVVDSRGREMQGMLGWSEMMSGFGESGFDASKQSVGPLPPGAYTVKALTADGKETTRPVNLDGQPERRLKIRIH